MKNRLKTALGAAALLGILASAPGRCAQRPAALLWIPEDSFSDWAALGALLAREPALKLTVGLSPEMITPAAKEALGPWLSKGRLEAALRLAGDPILPLIAENPAAPRPEDVVRRIAAGRERYRAALGANPAGFAPGGGAVAPGLFGAFKEMGLSWVATGDYAPSTASWASSDGVSFVALRELDQERLSGSKESGCAAFVVDEADGLAAPGSMLSALGAGKGKGWTTVAEALLACRGAPRSAEAVKDWPSWAGDLALWRAPKGWALYGDTALALERYQDSGGANLALLEAATEALDQAQAGRYYRLLASDNIEQARRADRELRQRLMAVYRSLKQTPPDALYDPILGQAPARPDPEKKPAQGEVSTDVHMSRGPAWIAFANPAGSFARAPGEEAAPQEASASGEPWRLVDFRVEWGREGIAFVYRLGALDRSISSPYGLGSLLLDTYIDVNRVAGAGAVELLEGRGAFAQPRDAWEYALAVTGWGAFLYRSNPSGAPVLLAKLPVTADPKTGHIRVVVRSAQLRGTPSRWGYIVAAMALDPRTVDKSLPRPREAAGSGVLLGVLAPLEQQKAFAQAPPERRRLAAVRAR